MCLFIDKIEELTKKRLLRMSKFINKTCNIPCKSVIIYDVYCLLVILKDNRGVIKWVY